MTDKYQTLAEHGSLNNISDTKFLEEQHSPNIPHLNEQVIIEHTQPPENTQGSGTQPSQSKTNNADMPSENKENFDTNDVSIHKSKDWGSKSKELHLEKVRSSDNFLHNEISSKPSSKTSSMMLKSMSFYRLKAQKISEGNKNFTHTEIFHQACVERKKASFNSLKNWDMKRARFLTMHRNILETIQDRLTEHVQKSQAFMQSLIKYLKDRATQEITYAKQSIEQFTIEENQQKIYQIFHQGMEHNAKTHQEHCANVEEFGILIEEKLLGESLEPEKAHYDKIIKDFHDGLLKIKKFLTKSNIEASEKSAKFSTLYFTMINAPFGKKTDKDLYRREISFLRIANEQVKYQRRLAVEIFNFWEALKDLEMKRVEISKKAIETYLLSFNKTYSFLQGQRDNHTLILASEDLIMNSLEMREILNPDEINSIITQTREFQINFNEFNYQILKDFFQEFIIKPHGDEILLTIREMKAQRDVGGLLSNYVDCKLILTVDGFLVGFDHPVEENEFKKPSMIVNLETTTGIKMKDEIFVEIIRTKPGFLMNSMERFSFKFGTKEVVEELFEYLNRYYLSNK